MGWRYGWYYDTSTTYYYGATITGWLYGSYEYGMYGWDNVFSFTGPYSWGWGWHLDYGWDYEFFNGSGYFDLTVTGLLADGWNSTFGTFEETGSGTVWIDDYTSFQSWSYGWYYDFDSWYFGSFSTNYNSYQFSYTGDLAISETGWSYGWYWDWSYGGWDLSAWWYDLWEALGWSYGWYYDDSWYYGWYYTW